MPPLRVVDLSEAPTGPECTAPGQVVVGVGDPDAPESEYWLQQATFTLVEAGSGDRRTVTVPSVAAVLDQVSQRCERWPHAASVCDDVLRAVDVTAPASAGVITESLAYSTLQAGPEFVIEEVENLDADAQALLSLKPASDSITYIAGKDLPLEQTIANM